MAEDWDLYAIVRSCTSAANTAISKANKTTNTNTFENGSLENPLDCLAALTFEVEDDPFSFPDLVQPRNICLLDLQDSCKPFLASNSTSCGQGNILSSSISDFERFSAPNQPQIVLQHHHQRQPQIPTSIAINPHFNDSQHVQQSHLRQQNQRQQLHQLRGTQRTNNSVLPLRPMQAPAARSRKKKSNQKRLVMHVTAENLSNDEWAWRKYGQKPIKGSPYPRNYYRCSSLKGCAARKQVERSNTDPILFIVSYTGDHTHPRPTHRNSLAGSSRNKFPTTQKPINRESEAAATTTATADQIKGSCSSPLSPTSLSPRTPLSAPIDNEAAAAATENNTNKDIATDDLESDYECDDGANYDEDNDDDNDDDILMDLNVDLIKGFEKLGKRDDQLGHSPAFGDNFSSCVVGGAAAAAGATTGGGC